MARALFHSRVAVATLFFVNGALFAGWVARVPDVRDRVGASEAELGVALLGVAVGSLVSMPLAGRACGRWGAARVAVAGGLAGCAVMVLPALAGSVLALGVALALIGAAFGLLDVAMNVQAIAVERAYGRPIMPSFHGWFSTGGLAGALAGGAVAAAGLGATAHLAGASVAGAAAVAWAAPRLHPHGDVARAAAGASGGRARATPVLVICGLIAFCAAVGEGAMADWSALYLTDALHAGPGVAALGYAAFAGAMAVGRFGGGRAIAALGPATTLRLGCGAAAFALAGGLVAAQPAVTIAAFAVAGLGVACVFPIVLSAAGAANPRASGPAVAFVSTIGYTGFLAGPPLIGFVAERTALAWGLGVVALLAAVAAGLAAGVRPRPVSGPAACRPARAPRAATRRRTPSRRGG